MTTTSSATWRWGLRRLGGCIAFVVCALFMVQAPAGPVYPGSTAPAGAIEQRLGVLLPLGLSFHAADGRTVRLGDFFTRADGPRGVPVILVLGYYRCPRLCETVMEGTLEALAQSGVPRSSYRVVAVSIDPSETPVDASARLRLDTTYADLAAERASRGRALREPLDLQALTGDPSAIDQLAQRVGFVFVHHASAAADTDAAGSFDHATGFLVVTPEGRVSRYFLGLRHDPHALAEALRDARGGAVGSLVERLVLLCAHVDPTLGRWSAPVLLSLRIAGVALALGLAFWIWRQRAREARDRP